MAPVRTLYGQPPGNIGNLVEDVGALALKGGVEHGGDAVVLGGGVVTGVLDEGRELSVGDRGGTHPEGIQMDLVDGGFPICRVPGAVMVPHGEVSGRNENEFALGSSPGGDPHGHRVGAGGPPLRVLLAGLEVSTPWRTAATHIGSPL